MTNSYYRVAADKCPDCQDWFRLPQGYVILRPEAERRLIGDLSAALAGASISVYDVVFDTSSDGSILKLFVDIEDKQKGIDLKAAELIQAVLTSLGFTIARCRVLKNTHIRKIIVFDLEVSCDKV